MRKVLSFVLVLSLVLGSISFAFAAPTSDTIGKDCEDAVNVLTELKVVNGYPDGTYKPENIVTRAEMAVIVVKAMGLGDLAVGKSSFKDMAGYDWAQGAVAYAQSLGIINGYPDGTFKPGKTVSYDEAATMLVGALGYTKESLVGNWPVNYVSRARALGILDDIVAGPLGANRGDIAIMVFQTLDQACGTVDKDGTFNPTIGGDTMMKRLGARDFNGGNEFILSNAQANAAQTDIRDYVGAYVTAYMNKDGDIISLKEVKSTFLTGEFNANRDKFTTDGTDIEYTVDTRAPLNSANLAADGDEFVNGVLDNTLLATGDVVAATKYTIAAKVSGKTIEKVYSAAAWVTPTHERVDAADLAKITASTPKLLGKEFTLDKDLKIDTTAFELVGVKSLADIKADNIVYVYTGGGKITKVAVGTATAKGEVTRVKGVAPDDKYTIAGKEYKVSATTATGFLRADLAVENEVEVWLDADGKIYDEELVSGQANKYAVVLSGTDGTMDDARLKLFLADGTEKTFTVDTKKVVGFDWVDTPAGGSNDGAKDLDVVKNNIVKYGVNSAGEINSLTVYTAATAPTNAVSNAISKAGYHDNVKIADNAFIIGSATIAGTAFTCSAASGDYSVGKVENILDKTFTDILYVKNADDQIVVMVIDGAGVGGDAIYGVLNGTFTTSTVDFGMTVMVGDKDTDFSSDVVIAPAADRYLYKLDLKAGSEVTATYLDTPAEVIGNGLFTVWTGVYKENGRLKNGGALNIAVADSVIVYEYDAKDGWTTSSLSDIELTDKVTLYATDTKNPGVVTFVTKYTQDAVAPTVVTGATTQMTSATTFDIKFSEAVYATAADFTGFMYDPDGAAGATPLAAVAILSIAGSGTDTITVTTAANAGYAANVGTATVAIGAGVKDLEGNALVAVPAQVIAP